MKRFTNLNLDVIAMDMGYNDPHYVISNSLGILSMHYNFLVSEELQGTYIDASNPFI